VLNKKVKDLVRRRPRIEGGRICIGTWVVGDRPKLVYVFLYICIPPAREKLYV